MTIISADRWAAVRTAVATTGDRFADLVTSLPPDAMATEDWTVADTAAHVTAIASIYTSLAEGHDAASVFPELADAIDAVTVDTVSDLNAMKLGVYKERDPKVLAGDLRAAIAKTLAATADSDPSRTVPWLGRSQVPVGGLLAHLLNELQIHGHDMARACGRPWDIAPQDAALFFDLFLIGVLRCDIGGLLDSAEPPRERPITVGFRSRHTAPVALTLRAGKVSIADPDGPVDATVRFDPTTLNLMMFHRISRARAVLTGKVVISGRRPWLLPAFLRTMRLP